MTVLAWQDPPTRTNAVLDPDTLAELRARPGEWALIRVYPYGRSRFGIKHPVDIELHCHECGPRRKTELYARAIVVIAVRDNI